MSTLSQTQFLKTFPEALLACLPATFHGIQRRHPYRWLVQFHFGEPSLHYEVSRAWGRPGWELGLHFEARDKTLNRYLLNGFRRHLFEIKDTLGEDVEAELWTRGWSKLYVVAPDEPLTAEYQQKLAQRLAAMIACLQPIFAELRNDVRKVYR